VWGELRRSEYLRLKRSDLGKKMFGKWQGSMLGAAFRGWVQFWMWNQGVRSAFQLDFATLKHSLDIRRLRGEQREASERRAGVVTEDYTSKGDRGQGKGGFGKPEGGATPGSTSRAPGKKPLSRKPTVPRSLLQRHVVRPVKCRHCGDFFLEAQNHAVACACVPRERDRAPHSGYRVRGRARASSRGWSRLRVSFTTGCCVPLVSLRLASSAGTTPASTARRARRGAPASRPSAVATAPSAGAAATCESWASSVPRAASSASTCLSKWTRPTKRPWTRRPTSSKTPSPRQMQSSR